MSTANKIKTRADQPIKVLIADKDPQVSQKLARYLLSQGFEVRAAKTGEDVLNILPQWQPQFALLDLMLPKKNAMEILKELREKPSLKNLNITVSVMSSHNSESNVRDAFKAGAKDYIIKPFQMDMVLNRLIILCRNQKIVETPDGKDLSGPSSVALHLTDLLLDQATSDESLDKKLLKLTQMANIKLGGVRCNIVRTLTYEKGQVVASNDDPKAQGIALNLNKYPEIQMVMSSEKRIIIESLDTDKQFSRIKSQLKDLKFNSLIVHPLWFKNQLFGVLSIRMPEAKQGFKDDEVRFFNIVAKTTSLVLSSQTPGDVAHFGPLPVDSSDRPS